ncbi:unnamed protein product [Acidithrix sp. C25]|nr:unnamed protein product [Acidithrix sp. C25]
MSREASGSNTLWLRLNHNLPKLEKANLKICSANRAAD